MAQREDIDIVITWVDGDDPAHRAKRAAWGGGGGHQQRDDIDGEVRFSSLGEIFYAVGSLLRFAPWLRTIWIITDNQRPAGLHEWVERHFPGATTRIEIVDHRVIFEGHEEVLPTFNSITIESMMWRIPGLAEHYLYSNDDIFLTAPVEPSVWFREGRPVLYGERMSTLVGRLLRRLKPKKGGRRPFGHKDPMVNAAQMVGSGHFWVWPHAPLALRRSWHEEFFASHPEWLEANIAHRFRHPSQFSYAEPFYIDGVRKGDVVVENPRGLTLFLKPRAGRKGYMERKLREAEGNPRLQFCCINSLSEADPEEQEMFHKWASERIGVPH